VAGKVQAVLAIWSVCLGGFAVAGVEPVEEEGVKGGSAGGAFAWREAEESGKTQKPWWFRHAVRKTASWSSSWDVQFCPGGSTVHRYDHTRPTGDQRHGCSPALLADQDNQFACDDWNLLSIPILFPRKKC